MEEETGDSVGSLAQWGCIAQLIEKLDNEAERIGWDALTNITVGAFNEAEKETDAYKLFFDWHQFFFRLLHRVRKMKEPAEFNAIDYDGKDEKYWIKNYDYKMFIWARKHGFTDEIDNMIIKVPKEKLTPAEIKGFDKKLDK